MKRRKEMGKLRGGGKKSTKSRKLPPPKTITVLYGSLLALTSTDQLEKNGRNSCFYKRRNAGARLAGANTIALKRSVRVFTKQEK